MRPFHYLDDKANLIFAYSAHSQALIVIVCGTLLQLENISLLKGCLLNINTSHKVPFKTLYKYVSAENLQTII